MGENKMAIKPLIDTKTGVFCHLLQLGSTRIIIDCGISPDFDYSIYDNVKDIIAAADCILLTSFDLQHMGAIGLFKDSRIFCTIPTAVLGKILLDELHYVLGTKVLNTFSPKQIKFSQPFRINNIDISSFNAGYIVGNAIYRIVSDLESIAICYNFNHRKESFLDGLSHTNIENSTIFMTNTKYLSVPSYNLRLRDEGILDIVSNCQGKVIFSVSYQRLLELICILSKHKITLVSKNGRVFMDRIRSMVVWAGSKAAETVPNLDMSFCKVDEISHQKIIILVNEFYNNGYLGSVIQKFNHKQNILVLVDQDVKELNFELLKIYEYSYSIKKTEPEAAEPMIEDDDDDEEEEHWSNERSTFVIRKKLVWRDLFPHIKRRRQNNEYGEPIAFNFEKTVEQTDIGTSVEPDVEEVEERRLVGTGIIPELSITSVKLYGISDYTSFKTVCEGTNSKMYVIADDNRESAQFLFSYFNTCRLNVESYIADNQTSFNMTKPAQKIMIGENVMNLDFQNLGDTSLAHFKAERKGDILEYSGQSKPMVFGFFDFKAIMMLLIENGFQIECKDKIITINKEMTMTVTKNGVLVETSQNDLLVAVRSVLYKQVTII